MFKQWIFNTYTGGLGDSICARDASLPINPAQRLFWRVRGAVVCRLFGWRWR